MMKHYLLKTFLTLFVLFATTFYSDAQTYCTPTCTSAGVTGDYIDNFTFGALSNLASGDNAADYALYSATGSYIQLQSYSFTIQTGSPTWTQGVGMWIDYNGDGSFGGVGELVYTSPTTATNSTTWSGSITIPVTAVPGVRRLRVVAHYFTLVTNTDTCGLNGFGEYEDYNITIIASTPCTGTPTAGITTVNNPTPCPGVAVNFGLSGSSLVANLGYTWMRGNSINGPWTVLGAPSLPTYSVIPPQGVTRYYRCKVTCLTSGLFDTSAPVSVTPLLYSPTGPCWCTSQANFVNDGEISNVTMGSLNNATTCAAPLTGTQGTGTGLPNQFSDFTGGVAPPNIYKGLAQPFSITSSTCGTFNYGMGMKIYIDYDHSGAFDATEEVYFSGTTALTCLPDQIVAGSFTVPLTAQTGIARMRIIDQQGGNAAATTIVPCGTYNYGETEDYLVNIIAPAAQDPAVTAINVPTGNCFTNTETIVATVKNYGSTNMLTSTIQCTLNVNGPNGLVTYTAPVVGPTFLNSYGATSGTATFTVNMFAGGSYSINSGIASTPNGNLVNDSLYSPITRQNYRPTAGPAYNLCQGSSIPFGQGLTVTGCATPLSDSVTITFNVSPCVDNVGATSGGTALTGANCQNQFACTFASGVMPTLPAGAYFTQNAKMDITNLTSGYITECRFNLFGAQPSPPTLFAPNNTGYPGPVGNITLCGLSTQTGGAFPNYQFFYKREITPAQLSAAFGSVAPGGALNIGYWESYNDYVSTSDIGTSVPAATTATLKIYYQYVPASFEWYTTPTGGTSIYNLTPMNPLTTAGSGITNSNTVGNTIFYAACQGSSTCRVPDTLKINPTPQAFQDSLYACEYAVSSNAAIFDLTTLNSSVSGNVPGTFVDYFFDDALISQIPDYINDTSSTNFIYSKVYYPAIGTSPACFSSDSVYLHVNTQIDMPFSPYYGSACAPSSIDVSTLINSGSTLPSFPVTTDTLFFTNAACTNPHPNPHVILGVDTVYIVMNSNTSPVCTDTAVAYVDIGVLGNKIVNQDVLGGNVSICGTVPCANLILNDGLLDTLYSPTCEKIASVNDITDGIALGSTSICEEIACATPFYNLQPYVNRSYQITPSTNGPAIVCLYYLDDDFASFNADAIAAGWPTINAGNITISQVDGGPIGTPGNSVTVIPNSSITSSYNATTTIWTVCFPVDSFSYFYAHTANPGGFALPINLTKFTGKRNEAVSLLNWTTSNERNNHYFVVERSKDGTNFNEISSKINSLALNGNSSTDLNYSYTDASPLNGHNYYRLQQNDIDGHRTHSRVVDVYFGNETLVTLYPNPVNTELNIDINTAKATVANVKILDATGRNVKTIDIQLAAGYNNSIVDLQSLADGVYMVYITNNKGLNYSQSIRKK